MKKNLLFAALMCGAALFTACSDDDPKQDLRTLSFEEESWNKLIDDPQYGGSLLYGTGMGFSTEAEAYTWTDMNTGLTSTLSEGWGSWCYWNGGIAVSNYIDANIKEHNTWNYQLSIPKSNGTSKFAVAFCPTSMKFADGKARPVMKMDVSPTTYELGVITYGNSSAASLAKEGTLTLVITGMNGTSETGTLKVDMAKDGVLLTDWKTIDLSTLGKVTELKFAMEGSDASQYGGINSPMYFALDNVVVDFTETLAQ